VKIKPDYNKHVLRVFKRVVNLPGTLAAKGGGTVRGLFSTTASRRAGEKVRQSRVRRGLRGLTPDHAQEAEGAKESVSRERDALRHR
jgi:hypothetical protein